MHVYCAVLDKKKNELVILMHHHTDFSRCQGNYWFSKALVKRDHLKVDWLPPPLLSHITLCTTENPFNLKDLFVLRLNIPVNNFSVMSGRSHRFLGN